MTDRLTSENLSSEIKKILERYNINSPQIFSVTSDNGRNMVKAVEILRDRSNSDEPERPEEDWEAVIVDTLRLGPISSFRCAPHKLQLAVTDFFKDPAVGILI